MAVILIIPAERASNLSHCPLTCHNGECMKYISKDKFFCRCYPGWSGIRCDIPVRCSDCSSDAICIGMIHNRSICVCPKHKGGARCLLTFSCGEDFHCQNKGECLVRDDGMNELGFVCICSKQFMGYYCSIPNPKLEISFENIKVSSHLLLYLLDTNIIYHDLDKFNFVVFPQKLTMFQQTVSFYTRILIRLAFVAMDDRYYLAVHQNSSTMNISTSISPDQQCKSINEVLNSQLIGLPRIRQVKYYHIICKTHIQLMCFIDESYMCLCTLERHANCFRFNHTISKCRQNIPCQNGGQCMNLGFFCSFIPKCDCVGCFFGDQCQYYAKGIGLTLDDILRYEIRPNTTINDQASLLKWSSAFTMIVFVAGLISSFLSIMTFRTKESRDFGCGLYLLAASITSLFTVSIFTLKFWFLVLTQINSSVSRSILQGGCISLEFILKLSLYTDNWLNACVALERLITVHKGVKFNKMLSKRIARWVIFLLPCFIMVSIIHEPLYRDLVDDKHEQRLWCVFNYSYSVHIYNTMILFFHFIGPFCANLFSALFIIFSVARRRAATQKRQTYKEHLRQQFKEHKNLIISPIVIVILTLPRLLISFLSGCVKVSHNSWLYLIGYVVSFFPSVTIFFMFVLPSDFYKKQFNIGIKFWRQ